MKTIPLTRGYTAIVDDDDYEELSQYNWQVTGKNIKYARRCGRVSDGELQNKSIFMHRQIMKPQNDMAVDHINFNGLDNRRSNLRVCTNQENTRHSRVQKKRHYKGVSKLKDGNWMAIIIVNGKSIYLGYFPTEEDAALAYNKKAIELFGEFACINDIPEREINRLTFDKRNTSGYYGVSYNKNKNKWDAKLRRGKRHIYIGRFNTAEEAGTAVKNYMTKEHECQINLNL